MAEKNTDGVKLRDIKLQIENLRAIITHRRSLKKPSLLLAGTVFVACSAGHLSNSNPTPRAIH
jgi:hypothetical protein